MSFDGIPMVWLLVGLGGQLAFSSRFLMQWVASERRKKSVVPELFWWLSLAGGACLLSYALLRRDPVFILGQTGGLLIYSRNLMLIYQHKRERAQSPVLPSGA